MGRVLSRKAAFGVSAAVVVHTLWTSAAPSMTYPLYAEEWHLTPTMTTAIFAVYPIAVVAALILFGDLSDHVGRRAAMLLGVASSALGVLLFAVAPDFAWVLAGRAFMGVGVGLSASPATAALVEFGPPDGGTRASVVTTAGQATGLALALLVGGALIEYAPWPTRLNFWVLLAVLVAIFIAAWFLPRHTPGEAAGPWRPRALKVPSDLYRVFAASTVAATAGFAIGTIMLSLGAQIARDLVGSDNVLVNGACLALFAAVVGIAAMLSKPFPARGLMVGGGLAATSSMALLAASAAMHSLPVFLGAAIAGGVGYSLMFVGGLALINAHAPVHHRAATLSALYFVAYLVQGISALLLGRAATLWGLERAMDLGGAATAVMSLAAAGLALLFARPVRPTA
jgi:predicted MFS family arabinose efflux permease